MGSHSLLQGIFPIQGLNPGLLHCRQILHHLSHQGSPPGHQLLPKSGWLLVFLTLLDPRIKFASPPLTGRFFTTEPPGKPSHWFYLQNIPRIQPLLPTFALGFCSFPLPVSWLLPSHLFVLIPCNSCGNQFKTRSDHVSALLKPPHFSLQRKAKVLEGPSPL